MSGWRRSHNFHQTKAQAKAAALNRLSECGLKWREGRADDDQLRQALRLALNSGATPDQASAYAGVSGADFARLTLGQLSL